MNEIMKEDGIIMVTVQCLTYNHKKYIRKTLESLISQKTNFRFEVVVHDDASTDGTIDIIKEFEQKYPKIIIPIFETDNQYSKHDGTINRMLEKYTKGKYIAYCEGDDYWVDNYKLQKQVDFLESHKDYIMCYGCCRYFYEKKQVFSNNSFGGKNVSFENLLLENTIPTPTVLFRSEAKKLYLQIIEPQKKGWLMGDYPMWLYFSNLGKIEFTNEVYAVYRVLEESASHSYDESRTERFILSYYDIVKFFTEYFNRKELFDINNLYTALFNNSFMYGNKENAKKYFSFIDRPSLKTKIKFFIVKHKCLYYVLKGILFNSLG